jgi:hypothetical protein
MSGQQWFLWPWVEHVHTSSHQAEDNDLGDSDKPKRLSEIVRIFHLGNETRKCDLSNECVADVQESIHACHEGGPSSWEEEHNRVAAHRPSVLIDMIGVGVIARWVVLDSSKSRRKNDTNECEEGRESCQLRQRIERPWERAKEGNERTSGCEAYRTDCVTTHGVEEA